MRRALKKKAGLTFSDQDIFASIHQIIVEKIAFEQPNLPNILFKQQKVKQDVVAHHGDTATTALAG